MTVTDVLLEDVLQDDKLMRGGSYLKAGSGGIPGYTWGYSCGAIVLFWRCLLRGSWVPINIQWTM